MFRPGSPDARFITNTYEARQNALNTKAPDWVMGQVHNLMRGGASVGIIKAAIALDRGRPGGGILKTAHKHVSDYEYTKE